MKRMRKQEIRCSKKYLECESIINSKALTQKQRLLIQSFIQVMQYRVLLLEDVPLAKLHLHLSQAIKSVLTLRISLNNPNWAKNFANVSLRDLVRYFSRATKSRQRIGLYARLSPTYQGIKRGWTNSGTEWIGIKDLPVIYSRGQNRNVEKEPCSDSWEKRPDTQGTTEKD